MALADRDEADRTGQAATSFNQLGQKATLTNFVPVDMCCITPRIS